MRVAAVIVAALALAGTANAARVPTALERAAITQALFDTVGPSAAAPNVRLASIKITTRMPHFPASATFYYRSFAAAGVFNPRIGGAFALLGYYVAPGLSGWRILSGLGSSNVGCDLSQAVFHGYKRAVMRDLRLPCF